MKLALTPTEQAKRPIYLDLCTNSLSEEKTETIAGRRPRVIEHTHGARVHVPSAESVDWGSRTS